MDAEADKSGRTEARMRMARMREHKGSATSHPYHSINMEEMMTATLPRVSAKMCRNTPENLSKELHDLTHKGNTI